MQVLRVTEYAPWKAAFLFLQTVLATFSWNFTDLFVMLLSVSLTQRFKQLNQHLHALTGQVRGNDGPPSFRTRLLLYRNSSFQNLPSEVWRQLRETYTSLACLTRTVDNAINNIVLLSFASNIYFICVQLLQGIKYVYFYAEILKTVVKFQSFKEDKF